MNKSAEEDSKETPNATERTPRIVDPDQVTKPKQELIKNTGGEKGSKPDEALSEDGIQVEA